MPNTGKHKVLIAGGSGFIGSALADFLTTNGYTVSILSRKKRSDKYKTYLWNPYNNIIDTNAIKENHYVINLAGAGIADKLWTKKRKQELLSSRVLSTRLLVNSIISHNPALKKFISASAIGYYGHRPGEVLTEESSPGTGFLSFLCDKWEKETVPLLNNKIPRNILRIGIVLDSSNGFLKKLLPSFKAGLNVVLGKGKQNAAWIHIGDLLNVFLFLLKSDNVAGEYNGVSPESASIYELQKTAAQKHGYKTVDIRINSWFIKKVTGNFSEVFLNDQLIVPKRLMQEKFVFKYDELGKALRNLSK